MIYQPAFFLGERNFLLRLSYMYVNLQTNYSREVWNLENLFPRPPLPSAVCQQSSYLLTYCRRKHAKAKYSSVISVYT